MSAPGSEIPADAANAEGVRSPAVWRTYAVKVRGFPANTLSARSRSAAVYDSFLSYRDAWSCSFGEFLRMVESARLCDVPANDGYDYIRRNYGVDVKPGDRVGFQGEGRLNKLLASVVYPGPSTAHVRVIVDGDKYVVTVHPSSIVVLAHPNTGDIIR